MSGRGGAGSEHNSLPIHQAVCRGVVTVVQEASGGLHQSRAAHFLVAPSDTCGVHRHAVLPVRQSSPEHIAGRGEGLPVRSGVDLDGTGEGRG
eukprot:750862-Hanusia_phi.AAC.2